jgi:hypothetical protein
MDWQKLICIPYQQAAFENVPDFLPLQDYLPGLDQSG